jgi:heme/copper-type cytochrome/quinol oxidase subunit 2
MKERLNQFTGLLKFATYILVMVAGTALYGQAPTHLPQRSPEPVGFFDNTTNIVFFVIIPIIIAIIYIIWRVRISKHK